MKKFYENYHHIFPERCKYIDIFSNPKSLNKDPGIDMELMGKQAISSPFFITLFLRLL